MSTVLITGARRGIGLDVAQRLAARGHFVYATVHQEDSIEPTREALSPWPAAVEQLDITNPKDRARAAMFPVDVLINNAALSDSGPLLELEVARVYRVLETNLLSTLALTQLVVRRMIAEKRKGRIIWVGSMMGLIPTPYRAPYAISKFALEGLVMAWREELQPFGIDVVMISPGAYRTGFNRECTERRRAERHTYTLYGPYEEAIRAAEDRVLKAEVPYTKGIAAQIVKAVEAKRPKERYVAPLSQWAATQILRKAGG